MKRKFYAPGISLAAFVLWTVLVTTVDVQPIGPENSSVGLAGMNGFIHRLIGVNMALYNLTDWLSLVLLGIVLAFGVLGVGQWLRRKKLGKVDFNLFVLGGFYILTLVVFALFEVMVVNYRPVLIDGILEASYPSSTTLLTLCVIPTAVHQLRRRIRSAALRRTATFLLMAFAAFMVIARLLSGVHWFSDIVGGILLSAGLVSLYHAAT